MKTAPKTPRIFYHPIPLEHQATFTLVNVFHEVQEFDRNYTLPFNMLSINIRAEGADASVLTNLKTGGIYCARENDITFTPCNLPQNYRHTTRSERYAIHFKLELYPGVDVFSGLDAQINVHSSALRREADEIFRERDVVLMLSRCQEFALRFCHRCWPASYGVDLARIRPFEGVLHAVQASVTASIRVEELAAMMNRSVRNFTRAFHDAFGMTPKAFLQQELFRKAARMLLAPDATVKTVAFALQFSSEFYFSKFFKRLSGISPKEYQSRSLPFGVRKEHGRRSKIAF